MMSSNNKHNLIAWWIEIIAKVAPVEWSIKDHQEWALPVDKDLNLSDPKGASRQTQISYIFNCILCILEHT